MKFSSAARVYVLGALLCAALTICSRNLADRGGPSFIASSAIASIVYLLAIREFLARPKFPRRVVVIGLVLAALWHLQFLRMPSGRDDDIRRYVWDGRVQRLGYNPYLVVPSDPAVQRLHTDETRNLNNPDVPSPYPAAAQLFFRTITAIHESTAALKLAFVVCDFAIAFVLLDVLRHSEQGAHLVLAYAWNPLLVIEVAGSGHIDIVGALLLLISFAALGRSRRPIAAVAFGLAVAVKLLPIVLLPLYWKRVRMRDAALAAAVVGVLYAPFIGHGPIPIGSLLTYVLTFRFNDPVFATLERAAPQIAAGVPVVVGFLTAIWLRSTPPNAKQTAVSLRASAVPDSSPCTPDVFAWPMAASLLCAPTVYPWYLLWTLPFLRSTSSLPIIVWTVSILPTYIVWHLRPRGNPWAVPGWVMLLEYGPVVMAGVIIVLRHLTRPAVSRCSMNPT